MNPIAVPCNCANTPPTMPTCRSEHLPTCPAYVHSVVAQIEREAASRPGPICAAEAVTARCIREVIEQSWKAVWCKRCLTFHSTRLLHGLPVAACPKIEQGRVDIVQGGER